MIPCREAETLSLLKSNSVSRSKVTSIAYFRDAHIIGILPKHSKLVGTLQDCGDLFFVLLEYPQLSSNRITFQPNSVVSKFLKFSKLLKTSSCSTTSEFDLVHLLSDVRPLSPPFREGGNTPHLHKSI
jgi:hypothetical protein